MSYTIPQNGKIDKAEHIMADYWQREEVDVILFRDTTSLMLIANLELIVQFFLKYVFKYCGKTCTSDAITPAQPHPSTTKSTSASTSLKITTLTPLKTIRDTGCVTDVG